MQIDHPYYYYYYHHHYYCCCCYYYYYYYYYYLLLSLSPAQGGIVIPDLKRESLEQFNASLDITAPHVNSIVT